MCGSTTPILAREPAARSRCIPPAGGSSRALNPFQSQMGNFAFPNPSTKVPSSPCGTLTNPARFGCRHLLEDGSRSRGLSPPPEPSSQDLESVTSPPAPNQAQTSGRSIPTMSWRRCPRDQPRAGWRASCGYFHILCDSGCAALSKLLTLTKKVGARASERGRDRRSHLQVGRTAL